MDAIQRRESHTVYIFVSAHFILLLLQGHSNCRRLTKERHTGWVYWLEFSQVFLKMVLAQLHSFFQDFLFPLWYCLWVQEGVKVPSIMFWPPAQRMIKMHVKTINITFLNWTGSELLWWCFSARWQTRKNFSIYIYFIPKTQCLHVPQCKWTPDNLVNDLDVLCS